MRCAEGRCSAARAECFVCGNKGHFARMCKLKQSNCYSRDRRVYELECHDNHSDDSADGSLFYVSTIEKDTDHCDEWFEVLYCDKGREKFKLDTGADVNVISFQTFLRFGFDKNVIKKENIRLKSYSGNTIPIRGFCYLSWCFKNILYNLYFAIADIKCQSLLGRKSCERLGLIKRIQSIKLDNYGDVFKGLGCLPGEHHIVVDRSVQPVVCASRKIPFGMRDVLSKELKKMEELHVIKKVDYPTKWVHPLVLAAKKNNGVRICLDPRELNRAVQRAHFQLPTLTEMAAKLHGAKFFSVLDANSGFWAIKLDRESADLCTFATPFGRYQFLRLPFGINSASEVFHGKMRQLLEDLEGVDNFVDDIIVWGSNKQEHDLRLKALLERARLINLKFNKDKCAVNYLSRFIPKYSEIALPLTSLLKKDNSWRWEQSEANAFIKLKQCITSAPVLALYDVRTPVVMSVDASRDALGAVLLQHGRPVEYASRTLTDAQRRYAQIEKELLAIVFACEKFHQYVYGKQKIIVESDHKPLESIFEKPLMSVPARLQCMMLRIQGYDLIVKYVPGRYMYIPDTLSRAPLPDLYSDEIHTKIVYQLKMVINNMPISNSKLTLIKKCTATDFELKALTDCINNGWPEYKRNVDCIVSKYWSMKDELFIVDGVIFRQNLVIIPQCLRKEMLKIIHEGHLGIDRCKRRARQVLYWPGISKDIEMFVKKCITCQESSNSHAKEPMLPINIPSLPWETVGSDIFEYRKKYFLVVVDYYSNFIEVCDMNNITSYTLIDCIKKIFSCHGIPKSFMTDNGPQYTSREFKNFVKEWGFDHITSSPNYPQSNGRSERAVQTVKGLFKKCYMDKTDFYISLLNLRNTPRDGLSSPAQLLMGRRLRCKLPVHPNVLKPQPVDPKEHVKMLQNQCTSKIYYDRNCKSLPALNVGDPVIICDNNNSRCRGTVIGRANTPRSYIIENKFGSRYRRNRRHLQQIVKPDPLLSKNEDHHDQNNLISEPDGDDSSPDEVERTSKERSIILTRSRAKKLKNVCN
ncbi:unnamed protein product [Leptosia nina]|uniref:RNA-directed DNA polymerase n=1 Tax=Leptosia nina TaxID=320188 RepID=A0AAV1JZ81_9NEOP